MSHPTLERIRLQIEEAERTCPLNQGWRFLYGTADTFYPENPLWFIGLNPGASGGEHNNVTELCRQSGNAFRDEHWGGSGHNGLQEEVLRLFQLLSASFPASSVDPLNASLVANYCPMRSAGETDLKSTWKEWKGLSEQLWRPIIQRFQPKCIVCMSTHPYAFFRRELKRQGTRFNQQSGQTGFRHRGRELRYEKATPRLHGRPIQLLRVPHLSHCPFFTSPKCEAARDDVLLQIRQALAA